MNDSLEVDLGFGRGLGNRFDRASGGGRGG
jgi:hypothetical protein